MILIEEECIDRLCGERMQLPDVVVERIQASVELQEGIVLVAAEDIVITGVREDARALAEVDEGHAEQHIFTDGDVEVEADAFFCNQGSAEELVPDISDQFLLLQPIELGAEGYGIGIVGIGFCLGRSLVVPESLDDTIYLRVPLHLLGKSLQEAGFHPVVGIDEGDVFAPCGFDAAVAGGGDAGVLLVDDVDVNLNVNPNVDLCVLPARILIADGSGAVGAAVIHQDELEVAERLGEQAIDTAPQIRRHVVHRDDDRYQRTRIFHKLPAYCSNPVNVLTCQRVNLLTCQPVNVLTCQCVNLLTCLESSLREMPC